jgi:hypothetical protein
MLGELTKYHSHPSQLKSERGNLHGRRVFIINNLIQNTEIRGQFLLWRKKLFFLWIHLYASTKA